MATPFVLPRFLAPDFRKSPLAEAPFVLFREAPRAGVLPVDFHATSIFPEYFHLEKAGWVLLRESRMDCCVVRSDEGTLQVREFRHVGQGDMVACGRRENGEDGILVHTNGFEPPDRPRGKFVFRTIVSRESSFSADYDELYALLRYERDKGCMLWVLGPAVVFDRDAREAMVRLLDQGFVHGLLAGNGLAVHDLEGSFFGTALGRDIYSKQAAPLGHYNHLDTINRVRAAGSIEEALRKDAVRGGIIQAASQNAVPFVLAGSIRDDGPLPEVIGDVYLAQDRMRKLTQQATTVVALATQLHTIATGNMVPSYTASKEGQVRPVYFFAVDMSEFVLNKLANRGSLSARTILTNAQDFLVTLSHGLLPG
ncbi:MAG: hypothetical protein P8130_13115 [Deltaproteobacteria bacterium]